MAVDRARPLRVAKGEGTRGQCPHTAQSENVQRDGAEIAKKKTLISRGEKKEEITSRNRHPHRTTASRFINTAKQARLHLLSMLS
jgi:hypothetical protein